MHFSHVMKILKISSFFFAIFLLLMLSSTAQFYTSKPMANLSTTWTPELLVQPMLLRQTNVAQFALVFSCPENFECGFSCPQKCTSNIFSILIFPAYDESGVYSQIVWSANQDSPVGDKAILNFTAAGELVLTDVDGSIVWTTNTAGKSVVGMNLTDNGNLVLFDEEDSVVWQSFDHPTDSLLPGQKLFQGQKLKSDVFSANSSEDKYSLQVTDTGIAAYLESNQPQAYFGLSLLAEDTHKGRRYIRFLNGSLSLFILSSEPSDATYTIDIPQTSSAQYMKLMPDGHLKVFVWNSFLSGWTVLSDLLTDIHQGDCGYPLVCGKNSLCSTNKQCSCPIKEYFRAVNERRPELGCFEITPLTCNSTNEIITLENVTYLTANADMEGVNMETCQQACLNNCSCKAAFFQYESNASSGNCFLHSEIFTMRLVNPFDYYKATAFIKVQSVTSPPLSNQGSTVVHSTNHSSNHVARILGSTIVSFVIVIVVAIGLIMYRVHKRKRDAELEEDYLEEDYLDKVPGMPNRFSYEELKTATENFSKKLGEGGFGSVFEGTLGDGNKIAVKCLEGLAHVKKSFLAEVESIGNIHHVNLVRLRGFCAWKSQRFLVYDFMSNRSLDRWIYHGKRELVLEWECRKKIILDIAKGLTYLHEECRQKIVHLDIKPQNILLDNDFNAKVSDFGLSKLIDKNKSEVMTTIKGTPGYIAPEWRSSIITEKVDVYSFGIVLLEILCGRKVFVRSEPEESEHLLAVFEKCWEEERLLDMIDRHSEDMQVHKTEVIEMMKLASWCLQTNFKRRPSMSTVVKVLEGVMNVESNLDYNFADLITQESVVGDEKDFTGLSVSLLSGPR